MEHYPEHFMENMEHAVGRPLESVALTLGADALTLLFTDTTPERSPKHEKMRRAYGEYHAMNAMQLIDIEYITPKAEPIDYAAVAAHQFGEIYQIEDYSLAA